MGTGKWGKYQGYKKFLEEADIVFLHGFYFRNSLLEFYYTHRNLLKKCIWIGWGIDIYNWKRPEVNIKNRLLKRLSKTSKKLTHSCKYAIICCRIRETFGGNARSLDLRKHKEERKWI